MSVGGGGCEREREEEGGRKIKLMYYCSCYNLSFKIAVQFRFWAGFKKGHIVCLVHCPIKIHSPGFSALSTSTLPPRIEKEEEETEEDDDGLNDEELKGTEEFGGGRRRGGARGAERLGGGEAL